MKTTTTKTFTTQDSFDVVHEAIATFPNNRVSGEDRQALADMLQRTSAAELLDAIHCLMHGRAFGCCVNGNPELAKRWHHAAAQVCVVALQMENELGITH